jgi:hypothetical protein
MPIAPGDGTGQREVAGDHGFFGRAGAATIPVSSGGDQFGQPVRIVLSAGAPISVMYNGHDGLSPRIHGSLLNPNQHHHRQGCAVKGVAHLPG